MNKRQFLKLINLQTGMVLLVSMASCYLAVLFEIDYNYVIGSTVAAEGNLLTLSGDELWTADKGNPILCLRAWRKHIARKSGYSATICLLGASAAKAFVENKNKLGIFDFEIYMINSNYMVNLMIDRTKLYSLLLMKKIIILVY